MSASENPQRDPYFGELHVHTAWSLDAFVLAALNGPDEAFRYAKGEIASRSSLNNAEENQLRRPLDFAAVTEHAEWLGEYGLIADPAYDPRGTPPASGSRDTARRRSPAPTVGPVTSTAWSRSSSPAWSGPIRRGSTSGPRRQEVLEAGPDDLATHRRHRREPQRPRPVHDAQRLRVDAHAGWRQPASGHHLPRQRRAGPAALQLRGESPRTALGLARDRSRWTGQRPGHHPQRELQQRRDVQPPLQRRPGDRRGLCQAPLPVGAPRRDVPEQGLIGDDAGAVAARCLRGLRDRGDPGVPAGLRLGDRLHRPDALGHAPRWARGGAAPAGACRRQPVPDRLRQRQRRPFRHARQQRGQGLDRRQRLPR